MSSSVVASRQESERRWRRRARVRRPGSLRQISKTSLAFVWISFGNLLNNFQRVAAR